MIVEKLKIEEIPSLLNLYRESFNVEDCDKISQDMYKDIVNDEKCAILVAKENNNIVGSVLCACCKSLEKDSDSFLVIESPIIKDGISKNDVGRNLLKASEEFAKKEKCSYGIVVLCDFQDETCKLYEDTGFKGDIKGLKKTYSFEN